MSAVPEKAVSTDGGAAPGSAPLRKRDSAAFLVRLWREPTTPDGTEGVVRCYMKNLKTGEEHYMGSADALASQVLAQLGGAGMSEGAPPETDALHYFGVAGRDGVEDQS